MEEPILETPTPFALRAQLEAMVIKDLLGPAGGPHEELTEQRVRDRYLVGMLAPQKQQIITEQQEDLERSADPSDASVMDVGATQSPSMFPSALGLTCCIEEQVATLMVQARWGWYQRDASDSESTATDQPRKVWRRQPMGGAPYALPLREGRQEWQPDPEQPDVLVRTQVRRRNGAWIITVFLVNNQPEAERLRDTTWLFQPELHLYAADNSGIFRQRMLLPQREGVDLAAQAEERALAMRYRHHVEFAVGHGVSVHAAVDPTDPTCATRIETRTVPAYEVPRTSEATAQDQPELADLPLDMLTLAAIPDGGWRAALQPLLAAYAAWIATQAARLGDPTAGLAAFESVAQDTLANCRHALERIQAGIALLDASPQAAEAFRFANRAMARQRVHGIYAEQRRRQLNPDLAALDQPANRSWRLFQLAFILLNLPGLTDLSHAERSTAATSTADLLWYPTGGGKTEAYLGLTAYTLAIRRLQGEVAGRSGMAGVAVIMRYTLRLLTLQQFQRASTLLCACEMLRREA